MRKAASLSEGGIGHHASRTAPANDILFSSFSVFSEVCRPRERGEAVLAVAVVVPWTWRASCGLVPALLQSTDSLSRPTHESHHRRAF